MLTTLLLELNAVGGIPDGDVPAPTVSIDANPAIVIAGQPFLLRVSGTSKAGLASVWWWGGNGTATIDGVAQTLGPAKDFGACFGMTSCTYNRTVVISTPGTYMFSANSRDSLYPVAGEPHQASEGMGIQSVTVTVTGAICSDECSPSGTTVCSGNGYKTCGNYDTDSCFEWGNVTSCASGYNCSGGICVQQTVAKADLTVTDIVFTPAEPKEGDIVGLEAKVANLGNKASGVVNIKGYIDGVLVPYGSFGPLQPNATVADYSHNVHWGGPWIAVAGNHAFEFVIDADNHEAESDETNNRLTKTIIVAEREEEVPRSDLAVTKIVILPSEPSAGDRVYVTALVTNYGTRGDKPNAPVETMWYLDGVATPGEELVSMAPGAVAEMVTSWVLDEGMHTIEYAVDTSNIEDERDETNNRLSQNIMVSEAGPCPRAQVLLCHKPGTPAEQELCVAPAALPAHIGHGDYIGACVEEPEPGPAVFELNPGCDADVIVSGPDSIDFSSLGSGVQFFVTKGKKYWTGSIYKSQGWWNRSDAGLYNLDNVKGDDIAEYWRTYYTPGCKNDGSFEPNPGCDPDILAEGPDTVTFSSLGSGVQFFVTKGKKYWTGSIYKSQGWWNRSDAGLYNLDNVKGDDIAEYWRTYYTPGCKNDGSFEPNPGCDPDIIAEGPDSLDFSSLGSGVQFFVTKGKKYWTGSIYKSQGWWNRSDAGLYNLDNVKGDDIAEYWRTYYTPGCKNDGSFEPNPGCDPDILAEGPDTVTFSSLGSGVQFFVTKGKKYWTGSIYKSQGWWNRSDAGLYNLDNVKGDDIAGYWRMYYSPECQEKPKEVVEPKAKPKPKEVKFSSTLTDVKPDTPVEVVLNRPDTDIQKIAFEADGEFREVKIYFRTQSEPPEDVPVPSRKKVSSYMVIEHPEIDNSQIENVVLDFKVEKSWLEENGVGVEDVVLTKFVDGEWLELETRYVSSDATYHYFEADSGGLSVFAVALKEAEVPAEGEAAPVDMQARTGITSFLQTSLFTIAVATVLAGSSVGYIYRNRLAIGAKIEDLLDSLRGRREERLKMKRK